MNVKELIKKFNLGENEFHLTPPTILQLEVTKNCNYECIMCHKGQSIATGGDFLRNDLCEVARKQIRPVFPFLKHAMLFGDGEPMVYPHFWDIVQEIRNASPECAIDFINNGSMMHAANRKKLFDHRISHLGLSIGGATPKSHNFCRPPGMFDKIIENYRHLNEEKKSLNTYEPYVTAHIVVMQCNYKELPDLVKLCKYLGIFHLNLQKLFVTHDMVKDQEVSDKELEPYVAEAHSVAKNLRIGLTPYPMINAPSYHNAPSRANFSDLIFREKFIRRKNTGYCQHQQPWNTVYVLHDGKVVPDCHWWTSSRETEFNHCGILSETKDILSIWNGQLYDSIRNRIIDGHILPQCRGCGLAGGVVSTYRCEDTDHTNPDQENTNKIVLPILSNTGVKSSCVNSQRNLVDIMTDLKNLSVSENSKLVFWNIFNKSPESNNDQH